MDLHMWLYSIEPKSAAAIGLMYNRFIDAQRRASSETIRIKCWKGPTGCHTKSRPTARITPTTRARSVRLCPCLVWLRRGFSSAFASMNPIFLIAGKDTVLSWGAQIYDRRGSVGVSPSNIWLLRRLQTVPCRCCRVLDWRPTGGAMRSTDVSVGWRLKNVTLPSRLRCWRARLLSASTGELLLWSILPGDDANTSNVSEGVDVRSPTFPPNVWLRFYSWTGQTFWKPLTFHVYFQLLDTISAAWQGIADCK